MFEGVKGGRLPLSHTPASCSLFAHLVVFRSKIAVLKFPVPSSVASSHAPPRPSAARAHVASATGTREEGRVQDRLAGVALCRLAVPRGWFAVLRRAAGTHSAHSAHSATQRGPAGSPAIYGQSGAIKVTPIKIYAPHAASAFRRIPRRRGGLGLAAGPGGRSQSALRWAASGCLEG